MFIRFSALLPITALAAVAAAAPNTLEARDPQCTTGELQCCQSTEAASDTTLSSLGGMLGVILPVVQGLIGLNCDPIIAVGAGSGATCTTHTVCCTDNQYNGAVSLGCTTVDLACKVTGRCRMAKSLSQ